MWYDSRNNECRGSIVYLTPGTDYQMQFSLPGKQPAAQLAARTWSESFPIAKTVTVPSGSGTLAITEGGSASGYVLYTAAAAQHARRGERQGEQRHHLGALRDPARLHAQGRAARTRSACSRARTTWSSRTTTSAAGAATAAPPPPTASRSATNYEAAVRAIRLTGLTRVIIQRNKIHHPRYGASSWSFGHPLGPQGIGFMESRAETTCSASTRSTARPGTTSTTAWAKARTSAAWASRTPTPTSTATSS
jgi:hypothetical protein